MNFGDKIKSLREQNRLKQSDLAKILKVSDKAISMWENNMRVPKMGLVAKIATYFGVSVDYLVNDNEDITKTKSFTDFDYVLKYDGDNPTKQQIIESVQHILNTITDEPQLQQIKMFLDTYKK